MKFVTFLFSFFLGMGMVVADDVYYSDYSTWSEYQEEKIESSDTIEVEEEVRYRYYYEVAEVGGEFIEGENPPDYPLIDWQHPKLTEFSTWQESVPEIKNQRVIESKRFFWYRDMKEVRYIHLMDFLGGSKQLHISEIMVYVSGQKVSYDLRCTGCLEDFPEVVQNGVIDDTPSEVDENGYIQLDLYEYYPVDYIEIQLYLYDTSHDTKRIGVYVTRTPDLDRVYMHGMKLLFFTHTSSVERTMVSFTVYDFLYDNPEYTEFQISEEPVNELKTRVIQTKMQYRYRDVLYSYYRMVRSYVDGFHVTYPGAFLDATMSKTFYRYRTREKIEVSEPIRILSYTDRLQDFIHTSLDVQIRTNLDYFQNGLYEVEYILPFMTISKQAEVYILDNVIFELQHQWDIAQYERSILKERLQEIELHVMDSNQEMSSSVDDILKLTSFSAEQQESRKQSERRGYWYLILVFLAIGVMGYLLFKKRRMKNLSNFVESV